MPDVAALTGPLDARRLDWVSELYGAVDPKYRRREYVEHLLAPPAGAALHAFGTLDDRPVAHACVVPTPARRGSDPLRAGKLEALVVAEELRGRRGGDPPLVARVLDALYELADRAGFQLLHAYVRPTVGRVIGFTRLDGVAPPSLVAVRRGRSRGERVVAAAQGTALAAARLRPVGASLRPVHADDADLFATPPLPSSAWAAVGDGAVDWYASSPFVRVLELGDGAGRALVQLPGSPADPLRVAAWRAERPGVRSAFGLLGAAASFADETGAASLRLQLTAPGRDLVRAARAVGMLARRDVSTLWVRSRDASLAVPEAVVSTPFLYLGF